MFGQSLMPPGSSLWVLLLCWLRLIVMSALSGSIRRYFGASYCQKLSIFGCQQPLWSFQRSTICGCLHRVWLRTRGSKLCSRTNLLAAQGPGMGQQTSKAPWALLLFTRPSLPVSQLLDLVSEKAVSERAFGRIGSMRPWIFCEGEGAVQILGKIASVFSSSQSQSSESVPENLPYLTRVEPLLCSLVGSARRREFLSVLWEGSPSQVPRTVCVWGGWPHLKASHWHPLRLFKP